MTVFEMNSVNGAPSERLFPPKSEKDMLHRRRLLLDAVKNVLDTHVDFSLDNEGRSGPEVIRTMQHVMCQPWVGVY
jgi:hypothetical protein